MRLGSLRRTMRGIAVPALALAAVLVVAGLLPIHAQAPAEITLGPGDVVDISVFGQADLTRAVTIRPDGKISLPLIGEMLVAGLTPMQLTEKLTTTLKTYLKEPLVTVTVTQAKVAEQLIYLIGEFRNPGAVDLRRGWTVMEAVVQAGGLTEKANLRKASIIRRSSNQTIPVDLDQLIKKGDQSANVALVGGDVFLVPEFQNKVMVLGAVKNLGVFDLKEGGRVLDAIVAAGGPSEKAQLKSVGVTRQQGDARVLVATVDLNKIIKNADQNQNILLQNADVVYVPENRFRWQDILQYISGVGVVRALFGF